MRLKLFTKSQNHGRWRTVLAGIALLCGASADAGAQVELRFHGLRELNARAVPDDSAVKAIVGATLIDGRGGPVVRDATVIMRGNKIQAAGPGTKVTVPTGAMVFNATGMSVLPGLIDAHFHSGRADLFKLPPLWLSRGVTSVRNPGGTTIQHYAPLFNLRDIPRLFLSGQHFDQAPVAYPSSTVELYTAEETRNAVGRYVREGASSIKVYFRFPLDLIRVTCEAAHAHGIPVTAHLELVHAGDAVLAGLDGIEHISSIGVAIAAPEAAEAFRSGIAADNDFRWEGRFRLWSEIDLEQNPRVQRLIEILRARKTFVVPTLGIFECRPGNGKAVHVKDAQSYHLAAFQKMMALVGLLHRAGVLIAVGTDTRNPHAELGWAPHHELQLLVECGLTPLEAVRAGTWRNAQFLGCHERLGSIEPGKLADLVVVDGDASKDIQAIYRVRRVMLDGGWIEPEATVTSASPELKAGGW